MRRNPQGKVTEEIKKKIESLYDVYKSYRKVANELGLGKTTVRNHLSEHLGNPNLNWNKQHREQVLNYYKENYKKHMEELRKNPVAYRAHLDKCKATTRRYYKNRMTWLKTHPKENREYLDGCGTRNKRHGEKPKAKKRKWEYHASRLKTDIEFRIRCRLQTRIHHALSGITKKSASTESLLGCSFCQCREHLEHQFKEGMSWNNYGEWHIDHIIPCASFDLTKEEDQRKCFHWSNLQPLWAKENSSKGDKIIPKLVSSTGS